MNFDAEARGLCPWSHQDASPSAIALCRRCHMIATALRRAYNAALSDATARAAGLGRGLLAGEIAALKVPEGVA